MKKIALLFISTIYLVFLSCFSSSDEYKSYPKSEKFFFAGINGKQIEGKLTYPSCKAAAIVIDVSTCLSNSFLPDSIKEDWYETALRDTLTKKGMIYFEFWGTRDSIWKYGRKFQGETMYTKAEDLKCAIKYLKSRDRLKYLKFFLLGCSEGGATSVMVASEIDVDGIILISSPGVTGKEFTRYQELCRDSLFMGTFGLHQEPFDIVISINNLSNKKYERNYEGYRNYIDDNFVPMKQIIYKYENYDTIAFYVMKYLTDKWKTEDSVLVNQKYNFDKYCSHHRINVFIQPEQIALHKWDPELYFTKIKCPVLAIFGSNDQIIEYSSSLKNMERMLKQGGNSNFTSIVLIGYDHLLQNAKRQTNKEFVSQVTDWILNR